MHFAQRLLPEIHFHGHDRILLTVSLLAGVSLAYGLHLLEHLPSLGLAPDAGQVAGPRKGLGTLNAAV